MKRVILNSALILLATFSLVYSVHLKIQANKLAEVQDTEKEQMQSEINRLKEEIEGNSALILILRKENEEMRHQSNRKK